MGAWIEMFKRNRCEQRFASHPTWVRGLKYSKFESEEAHVESHPTWVRGLKF